MTDETAEPGEGRIHRTDPFATPAHLKNPARQLRGRLAAPVTIWTAGRGETKTGLTMSSVLVADGEPPLIVGLMNDTTDLWDEIQNTKAWVVHVLTHGASELGDRFAGRRPSPGGLFVGLDVTESDHGPLLDAFPNRAYCTLDETAAAGYQMSVRGSIDRVEVEELSDPLIYFRASYRKLS